MLIGRVPSLTFFLSPAQTERSEVRHPRSVQLSQLLLVAALNPDLC